MIVQKPDGTTFLSMDAQDKHLEAEAERLVDLKKHHVQIRDWDIYSSEGFAMVKIRDYDGNDWRGYSKRCTYAPACDPHDDRTALSVALGRALRRARITRRKGA